MDYYNETVKRSWYPEEIQKNSDNQYRIEKVLRRRTHLTTQKKLFVRWAGLPDN